MTKLASLWYQPLSAPVLRGQSPPVDETPGEGISNNRVPFEGSASL